MVNNAAGPRTVGGRVRFRHPKVGAAQAHVDTVEVGHVEDGSCAECVFTGNLYCALADSSATGVADGRGKTEASELVMVSWTAPT